MSAAPRQPDSPAVQAARKSAWRHLWRGLLGLAVLLAVVAGGVIWYANTASFQDRVRRRVISTLEQATGGRVELGAFRWHLLHLQIEADNLTIHGLEDPTEIPYAHVDHLFVRAKILSFFRPRISLNLVQLEHPVFHLIVNADGSTNQPRPKKLSSGKPIKDTLFDLAIDRTQVDNGLAIVNHRATPFDLSANDLGLTMTYGRDQYHAALQVSDLTAQHAKLPPVHSRLMFQLDLARNSVRMSWFQLQTGPSILQATATLNNFADPQWTLTADGKIDVREVEALTGVPGIDHGVAALKLKGKGVRAHFALDGRAYVTDAAYRMPYVQVSGANVETSFHLNDDELLLPHFNAHLREGGSVDGELRILHWLPSASLSPAKNEVRTRAARIASRQEARIRANIHEISLDTIMRLVTPPRYQNLGFNTAATGTASVDWVGNADDLTAAAQVSLAPLSTPPAGEVPVSGTVDAKYFNRSGSVSITTLQAQTPASQIHVQGSLGVYPLTRESTLTADIKTTNLGEFDRTTIALGLSANGQQGVKAIPVQLHGEAEFHGEVGGVITRPDVKGHVIATNFETDIPEVAMLSSSPSAHPHPITLRARSSRVIRWDRLDAQAEVTPQLLTIQQATLSRAATTLHASGQLRAHVLSGQQTSFDENSSFQAKLQLQNAAIPDLLEMSGYHLPLTGTVNLEADASGTLANPAGTGHLAVSGGEAYGEPYRSLSADLAVAGHALVANHLTLLQNGGRLTGSGSLNYQTKALRFDAEGQRFDLAHILHLQTGRLPLGGELDFKANGSGTLDAPRMQANLHLSRLTLGSQTIGFVDADVHTDKRTAYLTLNSTLESAQVKVTAQTELSGEYQTQARLTLSNFDLDPILQLASVQGLRAHSSISANLTLNGPARSPKQMSGDADVAQFAMSLAGVPLKSDGALHAHLQNGMLVLSPIHIVGDDTDLRAHGTVEIFDPAHAMDMQANGSVNLKLAQSFNPNVTSSGHVDFHLDAAGTIQKPDLGGEVKFTNATLEMQNLPNGLSQMNGTLVFNQDRLEVKSLTAMTGGGQLKIGGFITYQQGLYGDLTATGKDIRIRYPQGISSMVDTQLRLQGSQNNLLLSGNVVLTRFALNPNLDLVSLTSSSGTVSLPPDPTAPTSHFRLDVHITSAPELNFQNSFAKLAGDVDLRVRGTVAQPSILGHISVTEGSATFAGTQYQLQHGDIYFTNPVTIEPVIDLDATARVEEYDLTIGLHGTLNKLNFTYRSEPPLPQADIFALLALGRTQEEQQIYSQQQQQAGVNSTADALLGGALNATVSSRIQKLFGGGSVKIDPTFVGTLGNSTARITVEQRISRNATLTYATNVNSTAQQLIQGQFDLTRNVSLLAVRDESGVFSMVLKVHKRLR